MSTTHPGAKKPRTDTREVTFSRELSLDDVEFEALYEAAVRIDDPWYRLQSRMAVMALGRLGLRCSELVHLQSDWVDERRKFISIQPDPCTKGKDGGICGGCLQKAKQRVEHNEELSLEEAKASYWRPKTEAGNRRVFYGFSARVEKVVEEFVDEWDVWPVSETGVGRRLDRAARQSDVIAPSEISPHPLRATAASYHAGRGLDHTSLMQHFGWATPGVAKRYIKRSPEATARQMSTIHSR